MRPLLQVCLVGIENVAGFTLEYSQSLGTLDLANNEAIEHF
jgi:hypothetical protein